MTQSSHSPRAAGQQPPRELGDRPPSPDRGWNLTVTGVARRFGVALRTVVRRADEGRLPCTRTLGSRDGSGHRRFRETDIEALLAARAGLARCGDASTPGVPVYEQVFPGLPGQAGQVRAALRGFLDGCPVADEVILLVSELVANAVLYSGSGKPGGQFTVRARDHHGDHVYAEVEDQGSTWHADLATSAHPPHGLYLLRAMSDACGTIRHPCARVVWFTIGYPREPAPEHHDPIPITGAAP